MLQYDNLSAIEVLQLTGGKKYIKSGIRERNM